VAKVRVEWLEDSHECETCGWSYAEGAAVYVDEKLILDLEPVAHCFGGQSFDRTDVFRKIIEAMGNELAEND
jgi:hypothetical protein